MPEVTIALSDTEYSDLQRVAEERLEEPEHTAHSLLVDAIADALANSTMSASQRALNRGVMEERRRGIQIAAFNRAFERQRQLALPRRR